MACNLNDYFSSVFTKNDINNDDVYVTNVADNNFTFGNFVITEEEVVKTIGEFKMHKSPGVDGITSTYALKTKSILAKPLTLLFNSSLKDNVIPNDWKKANVSPIFKNGDKSLVSNYRPISLTSFYGQVLEKNC